MPMRLDLHMHSTASDGALSPAAVARRAAGRLDVIALTDHDTVAGRELLERRRLVVACKDVPQAAVEVFRGPRGQPFEAWRIDHEAAGVLEETRLQVELPE